jgi:hypothetical protein
MEFIKSSGRELTTGSMVGPGKSRKQVHLKLILTMGREEPGDSQPMIDKEEGRGGGPQAR